MSFKIKEMFATLQGEGSKAGQPSLFVRFAGCNLWSGNFDKRVGRGACSEWCDTDFVGGEKLTLFDLIARITDQVDGWKDPMIVFTGGEPCLQLKSAHGEALIRHLLGAGYWVAVETNGTVQADALRLLQDHPKGHITVSPKPLLNQPEGDEGLDHLVVREGTDLKIILPSKFSDDQISSMSEWGFEYRYFQPKDCDDDATAGVEDVRMAASRDGWRVSIQTHKLVGLP